MDLPLSPTGIPLAPLDLRQLVLTSADTVVPDHVVGRRLAQSFATPRMTLHSTPQGLALHDSGETLSFPAMMKLRSAAKQAPLTPDQVMAQVTSATGLAISNVGVSATLRFHIGGRTFLGVVYQDRTAQPEFGDKVLKKVSGYWDLSQLNPADTRPQQLEGMIHREIGGEVVPHSHGLVHIGLCLEQIARKVRAEVAVVPGAEVNLSSLTGEPVVTERFERLRYHGDSPWTVVPGLLARESIPSVHPGEISFQPSADGMVLPRSNVGAYISTGNGGVQLVWGFDVIIPEGPLSLAHTEERPVKGGVPGLLDTVLDADGLVLLEVDARGIPTGEKFWYMNGKLIPALEGSAQISFSEAFRTPPAGFPGIITESNVSADEYFASLR